MISTSILLKNSQLHSLVASRFGISIAVIDTASGISMKLEDL